MVFRKAIGKNSNQTFGLGVLLKENIVTGHALRYTVMAGGVGAALARMQGPQSRTEFMEITDIYWFRAWSQMFVCRISTPPTFFISHAECRGGGVI